MNYEKDIRIDETALDLEWLSQAELAIKYGRYWATCKDRVTRAEENIKLIRSELIAEANDNPVECCNKEKPNAADIEAYYRRDKRHIKAKDEWLEASKELSIAEVVKNEISFTRKAALENLVILHGQQYFAGPSVARNLSKERELKQAKRQEINTRVRLNRS